MGHLVLGGGIVHPHLPSAENPLSENPQRGEIEALELLRRRWEFVHG